jgi:mono/diheme cytochrome c family protein
MTERISPYPITTLLIEVVKAIARSTALRTAALILKNSRDLAKIVQIVQQGGGQMPSLGSSLTAKDLWDVSAYVREKLVQ